MVGKQAQEEGKKKKKSYITKEEKFSPCSLTPESLVMPLFINREDQVCNIHAYGDNHLKYICVVFPTPRMIVALGFSSHWNY